MSNSELRSSAPVDRRILRTKHAIRQAFLSLLADRAFEDITVSALSERAGINRKTFYLHYNSTRELFDEIRREESIRISRLPCWKKLGKEELDPYEVFLEMNKLIEQDRPLYRALLSPVSSLAVLQKVKEKVFESDELKAIRRQRPDIDYYLEYTISGLFSLYLRWLSDPNHISIEELARVATELTHNGLRPLIEIAKSSATPLTPPIATKLQEPIV